MNKDQQLFEKDNVICDCGNNKYYVNIPEYSDKIILICDICGLKQIHQTE